jgi:hypothetical protein
LRILPESIAMSPSTLLAMRLAAVSLAAGGIAALFDPPSEAPRLPPELSATTDAHVRALAWERSFCRECEEAPAGASEGRGRARPRR